jgi:hypothetical protein
MDYRRPEASEMVWWTTKNFCNSPMISYATHKIPFIGVRCFGVQALSQQPQMAEQRPTI